jgi:hypothetical protein
MNLFVELRVNVTLVFSAARRGWRPEPVRRLSARSSAASMTWQAAE